MASSGLLQGFEAGSRAADEIFTNALRKKQIEQQDAQFQQELALRQSAQAQSESHFNQELQFRKDQVNTQAPMLQQQMTLYKLREQQLSNEIADSQDPTKKEQLARQLAATTSERESLAQGAAQANIYDKTPIGSVVKNYDFLTAQQNESQQAIALADGIQAKVSDGTDPVQLDAYIKAGQLRQDATKRLQFLQFQQDQIMKQIQTDPAGTLFKIHKATTFGAGNDPTQQRVTKSFFDENGNKTVTRSYEPVNKAPDTSSNFSFDQNDFMSRFGPSASNSIMSQQPASEPQAVPTQSQYKEGQIGVNNGKKFIYRGGQWTPLP